MQVCPIQLRFRVALYVAYAALGIGAPLAGGAANARELKYTVSWIGNSFSGNPDWVQQDIAALHVTPDGTVYTNVHWDEAGRNVGVYKNGVIIGDARHTHGWGYNGGRAIAVNDKYVFIAQSMNNAGGSLKDESTWPPKGFSWQGVSRRLRSDITKGAPFAGGKGGKGDTLPGSFLVVAQIPAEARLPIRGLWADDARLYVTDPQAKVLRIYDAETMAPLSSWPLERQGPLLTDGADTLWILQNDQEVAAGASDAEAPSRSRIVRYTTDGKPLPQQISFTAAVVPSAMCLDNRGRLLVADDGPAQQLLVFENLATTPRLSGTFGQKGGIYAGTPGAFGDLKFNRPVAVGCDAAGNIYVAHGGQSGNGGAVLESYLPSGRLNWRVFGLEFVDVADADPTGLEDVFTKEERFRMDYARPRGQEWTYAGFTIHRFRYPQDPRWHIWSAGAWVRRIQGRRFLFVNDMNAEHLQVYRFEPNSEIAIPSGLFAKRRFEDKKRRNPNNKNWPPHQPAKGEWIWRDAGAPSGSGNGAFDAGEYLTRGDDAPGSQGWWVDEGGNVWLASETQGIRMYPLQGLDAHGNPMWDFSTMRTFTRPKEFKRVKRLRYDVRNDALYLGGTTEEHENQHWKPMGPVLARYDGWLRGDKTLRWRIVAPYAKGSSRHASCEPMSFDVAGDHLFVPYTGASEEMKFSTGHIEIFRAGDGSSVGSMEPPADVGKIGLQDVRECLTARRKADGEYLVFLEEDWKAKILLYRWKPEAR
jgi:hypothetical protein